MNVGHCFFTSLEHRRNRRLDLNFQEVVHSVRTGNDEVAKQKRHVEDRIDTHKNARLTPKGREEIVRTVVDGRLAKAAAACRATASAAGGTACPSLCVLLRLS